MTQKKSSLGALFFSSLLLSAAVLFFCSKSSFAYPINDWSDANIYLTAGNGMLHGRVMYRDLYDHKGPVLYALHALCALIAPGGFLGVYALECLCAAAFLTVSARLIGLYGGGKAAPLALPVLAMAVYTSYSFLSGDSAEELTLPAALFSLYLLLEWLKTSRPAPMGKGRLTLLGFLLGTVFWTKFTLCGVPGAAVLLALCLAGSSRAALRALGWALAGFCLSTLPWLVYFGLNGAILPWLKTYLYDNLFLYAGGEEALSLPGRAREMLKSAWDWVWQNPLYSLPALAGVACAAFRRQARGAERATWLLSFALCALGAFAAGKPYPYYALALAVFTPAFFLPLCRLLSKRLQRVGALAAGLCVLCVGLCAALSPNVAASFGVKREDTMQYQFAAIVNQTENPTLLNYGFMDAGFYTAAAVPPTVKFYHQTNVPLPEMLSEQERYITEALCDYVVTRGRQPDDILARYDLIATADSPAGFWYEHVYLYRRKGLGTVDN